jgi:hypothetical protein
MAITGFRFTAVGEPGVSGGYLGAPVDIVAQSHKQDQAGRVSQLTMIPLPAPQGATLLLQ